MVYRKGGYFFAWVALTQDKLEIHCCPPPGQGSHWKLLSVIADVHISYVFILRIYDIEGNNNYVNLFTDIICKHSSKHSHTVNRAETNPDKL